MVIEEFSWHPGTQIRITDKKEYNCITAWEKDLMLHTIAGTHVGYKQYNCSMKEFDAMSQLQKSQSVAKQKFDKAAYRGVSQ